MSPFFHNILETIKRDGLQIAVGFSVLASFAFVTYAVIYVKAANVDMANMLIGGIYTLMSGLVGYYFGTSKSSADKTRLMAGKDAQQPR